MINVNVYCRPGIALSVNLTELWVVQESLCAPCHFFLHIIVEELSYRILFLLRFIVFCVIHVIIESPCTALKRKGSHSGPSVVHPNVSLFFIHHLCWLADFGASSTKLSSRELVKISHANHIGHPVVGPMLLRLALRLC